MDHDELRTKLAELQEARAIVEKELETLENRKDKLERLVQDRNALMDSYVGILPEALEDLTPNERHQLYKMLQLEVIAYPDKTLQVSGSFGSQELGTSKLRQ